MMLITREIEAKLPALYSTEDVDCEAKVAVFKIFDPCGRGTWYICEGSRQPDGDLLMFGYVVSPLGPDCSEWGEISMNELQSVKGRMGIGLERDLHFDSQPIKKYLES